MRLNVVDFSIKTSQGDLCFPSDHINFILKKEQRAISLGVLKFDKFGHFLCMAMVKPCEQDLDTYQLPLSSALVQIFHFRA